MFIPYNNQFSNTNWVSCNPVHFSLPRVSTDSMNLRFNAKIQPPIQMPAPNGVPRIHILHPINDKFKGATTPTSELDNSLE